MNFEDTKRKNNCVYFFDCRKDDDKCTTRHCLFFLNLIFEKKRMTTNYTLIIVPFCVCLFVVEKTTMNTLTHLHLLFLLFFFATNNDNDELGTYCLPLFFICLFPYREDDDKHPAPHCPFVYYLCLITEKIMTSIVHRHLFIPLQKRWQ